MSPIRQFIIILTLLFSLKGVAVTLDFMGLLLEKNSVVCKALKLSANEYLMVRGNSETSSFTMADIKKFDLLHAINGKTIDVKNFRKTVRDIKKNAPRKIVLTVLRKKKLHEVTVFLPKNK